VLTEKLYEESYIAHNAKTIRFLQTKGCQRDQAEDLAQQAWILAWQKRNQFRGESSVLSWVTTIAFNCLRSYYRKNREDTVDPAIVAQLAPNYREAFDAKLDAATLLARLPKEQARLLWRIGALEESAADLGVNRLTIFRFRRKVLPLLQRFSKRPKLLPMNLEREFGGNTVQPEYQRMSGVQTNPAGKVWDKEIELLMKAALGARVYIQVPRGESYAVYSQRLRAALMMGKETRRFRWSLTKVFQQDDDYGSLPLAYQHIRVVRSEKIALQLPAPKTEVKETAMVPVKQSERETLPALRQALIGDCPEKAEFTKAALQLYSADAIRDEAWEQLNDVKLPELAARIKRWDLAKSIVEFELERWAGKSTIIFPELGELYLIMHKIMLERIEQEELRVEALEQKIRDLKAGKQCC
jgi:RNA polymerase sigma factor (sigma-70 family)